VDADGTTGAPTVTIARGRLTYLQRRALLQTFTLYSPAHLHLPHSPMTPATWLGAPPPCPHLDIDCLSRTMGRTDATVSHVLHA